jgi:hypothetical protein
MNPPFPIDAARLNPQSPEQTSPAGEPGYRFVSNIAASDLDRALRAIKIAAPKGEMRLVLIACSDLGLPLKGAALYVMDHLPEPDLFWNTYRSLAAGVSA